MERSTTDPARIGTQIFYDAFQASPVGIAVENMEGQPLFVNPALCSMLGYSEEEMRQKHCVEFSPPEDANKDWALFQQLRAGTIDHYQVEKRFFRRDGSLIWGRLTVSMLNHQDSQLVFAMVESEERFRLVAKNAPVMIWMAGPEKSCTYFNDAWRAFTGISIASGLGSGWLEGIHPEDLGRCMDFYAKRFDRREPVKLEYRRLRQDREYRWLSDTAVPRANPDGSFAGYIGWAIDITEQKLADESLRRSERRFSQFFTTSPEYCYMVSPDGTFLDVNPALCERLGYSRHELLGRPVPSIYAPECHFKIRELFERWKQTGQLRNEELTVLTKQGEPRTVIVNTGSVTDAQGKLLHSTSVAVDITERKQFEKSLLWRLELEDLVSGLSTTFIGLPEKEIDARIEWGLTRLGEFLKMDRISLFWLSQEGAQMASSFSWNASGVSHAPASLDVSRVLWWMDRVSRGEVSLLSRLKDLPEEATTEREYLRRQGIVSAASIPLNVGGNISGVITFVSVTSEILWTTDLVNQLRVVGDIFSNALKRKRAMEALLAAQAIMRESEERFRLVANTAPVMIWMIGVDNLCTYLNHGWLEFAGGSFEEEIGNGWLTRIHPEDLEGCVEIFTKAFDRREPFKMEYRRLRHDGEYRWMLDSGVPRFNPDGFFEGYIGSAVDVTERKLAEQALSGLSQRLIEAQEEERVRIARELHDDISQRVAGLAIRLDGLEEQLPEAAAESKQGVQEVRKEVERLGKDIQALSRSLHSSKLDLLGLERACSSFCTDFADLHGLDVGCECGNIPRPLPRDISLCLYRILQETLQNAAKHSGSPRIEVSIEARSDEVELTVHDSGVGFDPDEALKGNGLGLTSMRERIKLVKGQLSIDSRLHEGTTVRARVPLSTHNIPAAEPSS